MFVGCGTAPLLQPRTTCLGSPTSRAANKVINPQALADLLPNSWIIVNLERHDYCFVA